MTDEKYLQLIETQMETIKIQQGTINTLIDIVTEYAKDIGMRIQNVVEGKENTSDLDAIEAYCKIRYDSAYQANELSISTWEQASMVAYADALEMVRAVKGRK